MTGHCRGFATCHAVVVQRLRTRVKGQQRHHQRAAPKGGACGRVGRPTSVIVFVFSSSHQARLDPVGGVVVGGRQDLPQWL